MATQRISASKLIQAPAQQIYTLLADYRNGHPRILPRPPFVSLDVEQGGSGAGTVIHYQMRLFGRLQAFRAAITEPDPGRKLVETDLDTGAVTAFLVEPRANGQQAEVTITTETKVREGFPGAVEGWLASRLLQPVYAKELEQLAAMALQHPIA